MGSVFSLWTLWFRKFLVPLVARHSSVLLPCSMQHDHMGNGQWTILAMDVIVVAVLR